MALGFLHTTDAHVAAVDRLVADASAPAARLDEVDASLLDRALPDPSRSARSRGWPARRSLPVVRGDRPMARAGRRLRPPAPPQPTLTSSSSCSPGPACSAPSRSSKTSVPALASPVLAVRHALALALA